MRFVIEREKWLRGEGGSNSALLRTKDQKQCCMGQVASQCGVDAKALEDESYLETLVEDDPDWLDALETFVVNEETDDDEEESFHCEARDWVEKCYSVNDDDEITDEARERRLSELFAANGHELVFTD